MLRQYVSNRTLAALALLIALVRICSGDDPPVAAPPLRQIFNQLRQLGTPAERPAAENPSAASSRKDRDPVVARAPRDPRLEAILTAAQEAIERKDWKGAVERLQTLLDLPDDALLPLPNDRGESLRTTAQRILAAAPGTILTDYERQYGGLARQLLDDAWRTSSIPALVNVATRFPVTQAGREASRWLAAWHFDHGDFALAYRAFREEWEQQPVPATDVLWRLQAAYSALRVGEAEMQRTWLAGVTDRRTSRPIRIGGREIEPATWWKEQQSIPPSVVTPQTDWRQLGGGPSRNGIGSAGEPLLLPAWSTLLTNNAALLALLKQLQADLTNNQTITIPAASPVIVGDRVAFRDLRGVRVVDLASGKTLWETAEGVSPERILNGVPLEGLTDGDAFQLRQNARQMHDEYFGDSAQHHPLANWLYRDGTSGLISSDGKRLFVLEDVAVLTRNQAGYQWEGEGTPADPFGANWSSNRLSAYDLNTGRLQWTVGGPLAGEVQELPLAGAFFLGVPVADAGELYAVAIQGEEIRLQALDPETGRPRWSQLLAYADSKIELDLVRRWIGAPVTMGQGLVICPTATGWLVAVDRMRRQLAWAYRYLPHTKSEEDAELESPFLMQSELGEAWTVGAPIVQGSRVVFAPPDGDSVWCLSLVDGRVLWRRDRGTGLLIAGTTETGVIVVHAETVALLALASGDELWSTPLSDDVHPSGRAAILGSQLLLPLSDNQVWLIDLADGHVADQWRTPDDQPPLENLVKVGDRLISLGAHGCRMFPDRSRSLTEVAARQAHSPNDPIAVLQQAELFLLDQQGVEAVAWLKRFDATKWSDEHRQQRWDTLWRAMTTADAVDSSAGEVALAELVGMARTDDQHWRIAMRQVDRDLTLKHFDRAFERLWEMTRKPGPATVTPSDDGQLLVHRDAWLRGRMTDVWTQAPEDVRRQIDARMEQLVATALAGPIDDWLAVGRWSEFHPAAARLAWAVAETWTKTREFAKAEATLAPWMQHAESAVAVETKLRLARMWQQFGLADDAASLMEQLTAEDLTRRLSTGETVAERLAVWRMPREVTSVVSAAKVVEHRLPLSPQRLTTSYAAPVQAIAPDEPLPYFQKVSMQIDAQEQRLTVQDRATGRWNWLAPLRTGAKSEDTGSSSAEFLGHRVLVLHRDVLQLASPIEKRIVWTRPLDKATAHAEPAFAARQPQMLVDPSADHFSEYGVTVPGRNGGPIAVANEHVVVTVGQRQLTAFDPLTGRELWRRDGLPPYATVVGSSDLVFVLDQASTTAQAYRDVDGRRISVPKLDELLAKTLAFRGRDAITLEAGPGFRLFNLTTGKTVLRRVDPVTQAERWEAAFKPRTVVGLLTPAMALAVQPAESGSKSGRSVTLIDLDTGRQRSLAALRSDITDGNLFAFCDADRIYLANVSGNSGGYHYGDSLATLDITGELCVWDRQTGDRLWQRDVDELNLVYDRFADSPVLMLLARNWEMLGNANFTKLHLLLLDKQSGEVRHESNGPSLFSGFHGVDVTAPGDVVELTSYNLRLRFEPQR